MPQHGKKNPHDYPDYPAENLRRAGRWGQQANAYLAAWDKFLTGEVKDPPMPSASLGAHHLKIAQCEWRKRNGYPEPKPVVKKQS